MKKTIETPGLLCPVCSAEAPKVELTIEEPEPVELGPGVTAVAGANKVAERLAQPCGHRLASLEWTPTEGLHAEAGRAMPGALLACLWLALLLLSDAGARWGGWWRLLLVLALLAGAGAVCWLLAARGEPQAHSWRCRRPGCGQRYEGLPKAWIAAELGAKHEQQHRSADLEAWRQGARRGPPFRAG